MRNNEMRKRGGSRQCVQEDYGWWAALGSKEKCLSPCALFQYEYVSLIIIVGTKHSTRLSKHKSLYRSEGKAGVTSSSDRSRLTSVDGLFPCVLFQYEIKAYQCGWQSAWFLAFYSSTAIKAYQCGWQSACFLAFYSSTAIKAYQCGRQSARFLAFYSSTAIKAYQCGWQSARFLAFYSSTARSPWYILQSAWREGAGRHCACWSEMEARCLCVHY